jgi:long-subunit acyl-CoA synthetase (AMP-forming)
MMVVMILTSGHSLVCRRTFEGLKNTWSGAAPLDKTLQARFNALLPEGTPFNQVWGMSETSCIATMCYYPEHDASGSVGPVIPNCDIKLVDDAGSDITGIGKEVRGELCIRGPIIVKGYYKNEEANRGSWDTEGFFHTGDIAYIDDEKRKMVYIVDRKKVCILF